MLDNPAVLCYNIFVVKYYCLRELMGYYTIGLIGTGGQPVLAG